MVKLTDRLQLMADCIKKGETMADIGTDHGFLPLYLYEQGICEKVILADVSIGSLNKAKENSRLLCQVGDFRLGDGLKPIDYNEVDVIVIAGMGGRLMTSILGYDINKSRSFKRFILQPRSGQGELRFWLEKNEFDIRNEFLVREGKFICEVLEVTPILSNKPVNMELPSLEERIKYELPKTLLINQKDLALELLNRHLKWQQEILEATKNAENTFEKRKIVLSKIEYIREVIDYGCKI